MQVDSCKQTYRILHAPPSCHGYLPSREPPPAEQASAGGVVEAEAVAVADGGDAAVDAAAAEEAGVDACGVGDAAQVVAVEVGGAQGGGGERERGEDERFVIVPERA